MEATRTWARVAVACATWSIAAALVLTGGATVFGGPTPARPAATVKPAVDPAKAAALAELAAARKLLEKGDLKSLTDAKAKVEAVIAGGALTGKDLTDAKALLTEVKIAQAWLLFDKAKADYYADKLDEAEAGFKAVRALGVSLRTTWRRNDPTEWLADVAARRKELADQAKTAAARKAEQDKKQALDLVAKAEADLKADRLAAADKAVADLKALKVDLAALKIDPDALSTRIANRRKVLEAQAAGESERLAQAKAVQLFRQAEADLKADKLDAADKSIADLKALKMDLAAIKPPLDVAGLSAKVADRRKALADEKAAAEERARLAEAERTRLAQARTKAEADLAEARRLQAQGGAKNLADARAKVEAALAAKALTSRDQSRAEAVLAEIKATQAKDEMVVLLAKAEQEFKQAEVVVADPLKASGDRGPVAARDALAGAVKAAESCKVNVVQLQALKQQAPADALDREQTKRLADLTAKVDALVAKANAEHQTWTEKAKLAAAFSESEIERQRNHALAVAATEAGDVAFARGDWAVAKAKYQEALNLEKSDLVEQKLLETRQKLGEGAVGATIVDVVALERIREERFFIEVKQKLNDANALMRVHDYAKAEQDLNALIQAINTSGFPEAKLQEYRIVATKLRDECASQIRRLNDDRERIAIGEATGRAEEARAAFRRQLQEKVENLIAQANAYARSQQYRLGFQAAEEALKLDPTAVEARILRDQCQMWDMQKESIELRHVRDLAIAQMIMEVERARVPHPDIITYPEDWVELSKRRKKYATLVMGAQETPAVAKIRQSLEKPVTIEFPGTSFENVVAFLADLTGVNIVTDKQALLKQGVTESTLIKLKLANVKLSSALKLILDQVNLDYIIRDEVVMITDSAGTTRDLEVRVYDVRDLVVAMTGATGTGYGTTGVGGINPLTGQPYTGTGYGGTTGIGTAQQVWNPTTGRYETRTTGIYGIGTGYTGYGTTGYGTTGTTNGGTGTTSGMMSELQDLIQRVIAPQTWGASATATGAPGAGGTLGQASIEQFQNQMLIINQTPKVHDQIWNLLSQLRQFLSLQVVIEVRLLDVADNFVEDMGIDWSIRIPGGKFGDGFSDITIHPNLPAVAAPSLTGAGFDATPTINLTIHNTGFLTDFDANFIISMTQKSFRGTVMTAPRVILMSGGTGTITVSKTERYVSDIRPIVSAGVVGYEPVMADAPTSSITLSIVNCAVSHDRRYVRLSLSPTLQTTTFAEDKTITSIVLPTTTTGGTTTGPVTVTGTVQRPLTSSTSVQTDVVVPDGGTVLMGGLRRSTEEEREEGVPVLSKFPVLKRFFARRSQLKTQSNVIILVKPTIVIPAEEEEKLGFPVDLGQ